MTTNNPEVFEVYRTKQGTLDNAPIGTRAPAVMGGRWTKTARGWKWCTGATFPRPGGDWSGKLILPTASKETSHDNR